MASNQSVNINKLLAEVPLQKPSQGSNQSSNFNDRLPEVMIISQDKNSSKYKCHLDFKESKQKLFSFRWLLRKSKSSRSTKEMTQTDRNLISNVTSSKSCDAGLTAYESVDRCPTFLLWKLLPPTGKNSEHSRQSNDRQRKIPFRTSFSCNDVHTLIPSTVNSSQDLHKGTKFFTKHPYTSWCKSSTCIDDCVDKNSLLNSEDLPPGVSAGTKLCKLCLGMVPSSSMYVLHDCNCAFCKMCLYQYLTINIREGQVPVTCPDANCSSSGKIKVHEIKEIAGEDAYTMFERYKLNLDVELDPYKMWCPSPGCETICSLYPSTNTERGVMVFCHNCKLRFCSNCKMRWHGKTTCDKARKMLNDEIELSLNSSGDEENSIKRCPNCRVPIEKDEGCAQMMCYRCKHVFCWHCLASLDDDFLLRHYDKGPCRNMLGHSRASMIWHRTQVVGIFAGFSFLLLVASPFLLLAAPCLLCCRCRLNLMYEHEATQL